MNEQENVKIAQQAYSNFTSGDIPSLLNLLADGIEWQLPTVEGVPFTGKRQGREAVEQFFASVAEHQEVLQFEPREFIAQENKVVALGHYEWRVKGTGREVKSDFAHVFTVEGGRITAFQEFFDSAAFAASYQKAISA
jgi:uncharacterized protein